MIVHAECLRYNACMKIVCATVLVETSPQALPLGASCIASSLKADDMLSKNAAVELVVLSNEDKTLTAEKFACRILGLDSSGAQIDADRVPQFVCMSIYVWNRKIIEQTAEIIKKNYPGTILIAGGPEVTANPFTIKNVDYTSVGQGEYTVTQLIRCLVNKTNTQKQTASDILCDIQIPGVYTKRDFDAYQSLDDAQKDERLKTLVRSPSPSLESLPSPYQPENLLTPAISIAYCVPLITSPPTRNSQSILNVRFFQVSVLFKPPENLGSRLPTAARVEL